jgi:hypothetical protein
MEYYVLTRNDAAVFSCANFGIAIALEIATGGRNDQ